MMRVLAMALLAFSLTGCGLDNRFQLGGVGPGGKTVSAKEEPITLVAVDGTVCQVTPAKFHRVKRGDRVWCGWRNRGDAPRPGGGGG
ncbi:MAG TPA: hypothetical protein VMM12_02900 [Longimicrobiales bacterium]|nr:hypothetical protein [Longimicrobiales bacterium]